LILHKRRLRYCAASFGWTFSNIHNACGRLSTADLGTGTYNPFFEAQVTPADAVAESLDLRVKKPIRED